MVMHAQSHAQAQLAAQELFPACRVVVIALEPPLRGTNSRPPQSAVLNNTASTEAAMLE